MRVLLFGNNRIASQVAFCIRDHGDQIVGLVVHPPERRKFGEELVLTAGVPEELIFDGSKLREPTVLSSIASLRADIAVSVLFGYILRAELLRIFPMGCINLHPALLPFNRGANPNVWSIVENTPAGATLHYIDEGVDTGDIIAQQRVEIEPIDTGETLYGKLEQASVQLFQQSWPAVREGRCSRTPQSSGVAAHKLRDVQQIDEIDLDRTYTGRELVNILRARTFPPFPGAYFRSGDRKVYMRLQLFYEEELSLACGAPALAATKTC
jgi:methionyl-tRNA formyltransferase